jgi:hypothetical protein
MPRSVASHCDESERHGDLVAPYAASSGPKAPPRSSRGSPSARPKAARDEIEDRERERPHPERAARRGNRDPQPVREAAGDEQQPAAATDDVDQPLVARVLAEAALEPAASAQPRHLEVGLVRQRVGGDRHGDDDGQMEEAAAGQERGGEQHGLALERDTHEEQRVAVFE